MSIKKANKLPLIILVIILSFSLAACSDENETTDSNEDNNKDKDKDLPTEISQKDWADSKQSVNLDTGIEMKYVEMGDPDGKPLVLIHGMTDNSRGWSLMAPYLAEDFHIYMIDLRGHGDSDKPDMGMYPISLYASDIASFIEEMDIEEPDIIGHSLGSAVAQTFAINYPDKLDKLVLESSSPIEGGDTTMYEQVLEFGENQPDDEFMDNWYSNPNPVDEEFLSYEKEESQKLPPYDWRQIAKGSGFSNLTPFMDELDSETLILWGTEDELADEK